MRVGIIALQHESNTFIGEPTRLEHFQQNTLAVGEQVREAMAASHHEVAGFFVGLAEAGLQAAPIFAARALPFGTVSADAFAELLSQMMDQLDRAGPLDGILAAPHGAAVSQDFPDADGHWLTLLRQRVGKSMPIIGTLDAHANLSPAMVAACDALVAYRSNPHLDQKTRGIEAAALMARTLRGEVRPTMAAAYPPIAINIERQHTSEPHLAPLYELADEMLTRDKVLSNSILLGFPYADVAEMGSATIAVTDADLPLATQLADELALWIWERRTDFDAHLVSIDKALDRAERLEGPICLLDMGDNVGGGSPADGTLLASAMHQRRMSNAFVCIYDPESVRMAADAGVGARVALRVGGKTDSLHGQPLEAEFTVVSLHAGKYSEPEPRHGGFTEFDQGSTAIVRTDAGLTIMLTARRVVPFSLHQLTSCGLEPKSFHILTAKGVNAPVAAYAPVCKHLIRVNTPGSTTADMRQLHYRHRRRPLYPFEADTEWSPGAISKIVY